MAILPHSRWSLSRETKADILAKMGEISKGGKGRPIHGDIYEVKVRTGDGAFRVFFSREGRYRRVLLIELYRPSTDRNHHDMEPACDLEAFIAECTEKDPTFQAALKASEQRIEIAKALIQKRKDFGIAAAEMVQRLGDDETAGELVDEFEHLEDFRSESIQRYLQALMLSKAA